MTKTSPAIRAIKSAPKQDRTGGRSSHIESLKKCANHSVSYSIGENVYVANSWNRQELLAYLKEIYDFEATGKKKFDNMQDWANAIFEIEQGNHVTAFFKTEMKIIEGKGYGVAFRAGNPTKYIDLAPFSLN